METTNKCLCIYICVCINMYKHSNHIKIYQLIHVVFRLTCHDLSNPLSIWAPPAAQLLRAGPRPFDRPSPPWKTTHFLRGKSMGKSMGILCLNQVKKPKCLANYCQRTYIYILIYHHIPIIRVILGHLTVAFKRCWSDRASSFYPTPSNDQRRWQKRMGPGPSCERLDWTWISKHWLRSMGISGS